MIVKDKLISVADVAKKLKTTLKVVRSLMQEGKIEATYDGKEWKTTEEKVQKYIKDNNIIIEPDDHPRKNSDLPSIIALSFFSGAMGLDIGMNNAGISALLACEFNKYCRMTIDQNAPDMALIGDINKYSADEILTMAKIPKDHKVDVVFGGPPCQAFSTAGARRAFNDERGNVFLRYLDIVNEIHPRYVVIENVRGLLSAPYPYKEVKKPFKGGALCLIIDKLRSFGYNVSFELYNAANFGAPQIRERIVLIGKENGEKMPYLVPTNSDDKQYGLKPWRTLKDAFTNLPHKVKHHNIEFPEKRLKYYRMLKEGQYWKDLPSDVIPEAMGNVYLLGGGRTGFYRRLSFNKPSPTLVTNPAMPATDLCHPTEDRPLSVEEYKAIQEFPAEWVICGPILEQYKQIGNAVPIKLGEAIGKAIIDDMNNDYHEPIIGFRYSRYKNTDDKSWELFIKGVYKKALKEQNENNIETQTQLELNFD